MRKQIRRAMSLLLVLAMLFSTMGMTAFAEESEEGSAEAIETIEATEEAEEAGGKAPDMVTVYVWMDGYEEPVPVEMPADEAPPEALGEVVTSTRRKAAARANLPTYEGAYTAMMAMMSDYPEGMTWTNYEPYGNQGDLGKYYRFQGGLIHGAYAVGVGCAAFCFILHDEVFPGAPIYVYDSGQFDWSDIHVGDFLRVNYGGHSVTVLKKTDNAIIVAEANYNSSVHWGRVMSKTDVLNETTYMVTSYPKGHIDPSDEVETTVVHEDVDGGLSWVLDSKGVLAITGSGAMLNYDLNDTKPGWYDYRDQIYSVEIGEGITSIGNNAFRGLETAYTNLNSATISTTVTSVGSYAFYKAGLTSVALPNSVKNVGDSAFYLCSNLTTLDLGNGVETIGQKAFYGCTSLKFVDIPSSVKTLGGTGGSVFSGCTNLYQVRFMPNTNIQIGSSMFFECQRVNFVSLPEGMTEIPAGMFQSCKQLLYLYMPGTLRSITEAGVTDPFMSLGGLGTVYFGGTEAQWKALVKAIPASQQQSTMWLNAVTDAGQVYYEQDDPFVPAVDDPGDKVTCATLGEHVGAADADGNCDVCGKPYDQKPGSTTTDPEDPVDPVDPTPSKHQHSWATEWTKDENVHWHECTAKGCDVTDNTEKDGYAVHSYGSWEVVTEAGVDSTGVRERVCECGHKQTEEIPATHEHSWATEWSHDEVIHWHECLTAGCDVIETYLKASYGAHDFGDWAVDKAATATTAGSRHRDCQVCSYRQTDELPATGETGGSGTTTPSSPGTTPSNPGTTGGTSPSKPSHTGGGGTTTTTTPVAKPTTTVTTDPATGAKIETTKNTDGSSEVVTTQKDGTVTTVNTSADGTVAAEVKLSEAAVNAAEDKPIALPIAPVVAGRDVRAATTVTVQTGQNQPVRAMIPVTAPTAGTVAVLVGTDGSTNVIKTSVPTEGGVIASLPDGATVAIVENSKSFADVLGDDWAADAVDFVSARELFAGTSATTFSPDTAMTRGMLMTVLARFANVNTAGGETWCAKGVEWAIQNGISDGSSPNSEITREQLVVMLWRYYGAPAATEETLAGFADAGQVSGYAQEAMAWAVENNIVNGFGDGRIGPKGQATRAQVAQILMNLITNLAK